MNKYTIGTVIGSALLGLAKSKGSKSLSTMPMQVKKFASIFLDSDYIQIDSNAEIPIKIRLFADEMDEFENIDHDDLELFQFIIDFKIESIDFSSILKEHCKPKSGEHFSVVFEFSANDNFLEWGYDTESYEVILEDNLWYLTSIPRIQFYIKYTREITLEEELEDLDTKMKERVDAFDYRLFQDILYEMFNNGLNVERELDRMADHITLFHYSRSNRGRISNYGWQDTSDVDYPIIKAFIKDQNGKLVEYKNQKTQPFEQIRRK